MTHDLAPDPIFIIHLLIKSYPRWKGIGSEGYRLVFLGENGEGIRKGGVFF